MGIIKDTTFRIIKRVAGMVQLRIDGSDLVLQEKLFKEIDYE